MNNNKQSISDHAMFDSMLLQYRQTGIISQDLLDWFNQSSTHIALGGSYDL